MMLFHDFRDGYKWHYACNCVFDYEGLYQVKRTAAMWQCSVFDLKKQNKKHEGVYFCSSTEIELPPRVRSDLVKSLLSRLKTSQPNEQEEQKGRPQNLLSR